MPSSGQDIREAIRSQAKEIGLAPVRFTSPTLPDAVGERLKAFLSENRHGDMDWMEARLEERSSPIGLWPAAKSVIMVGLNYGPSDDPMELLSKTEKGVVSVYARNRDYHDVLKKRLKSLARTIVATHGCELKVFVDTAPVMEKPLAAQAGVGWQGKHTNLVSRDYGSWLFLGAIYTTLDLPPDDAETDHCGVCQRCLDICPTNAFPGPYQLDARRCISYLTIEHKSHIPEEFRRAIGNRIYGCDDCLAVCPWNKFAQRTDEISFQTRETLEDTNLSRLARLDDENFRRAFSKSPIKRIGRDRFIRNVAIAIGNSGDPALCDVLHPLLDDGADIVRAAAIWAYRQIASAEQFETLRATRRPRETAQDVRAEWDGSDDQASTVT